MKKLTLAMLLALIGATAMAQNFEGKTLEERIAFSTGDNEDTIKTAKGYLTLNLHRTGLHITGTATYLNHIVGL